MSIVDTVCFLIGFQEDTRMNCFCNHSVVVKDSFNKGALGVLEPTNPDQNLCKPKSPVAKPKTQDHNGNKVSLSL